MTVDAAIKLGAECQLAKRIFFKYCNLKAPDFYKKDRNFLKQLCHELQDFYESDDEVLIVNMPPRHGKSRTVGCFVEWVLGNNQNEKIMTGSYNETLSTTFSKSVRNTILEVKADKDKIVYSDIFPGVTIKRGDGAMNMWSLENGYSNYLATSPTGTATGFGASLLIIDDLIKSAAEACNADVLEKHWEWFTNTMLSRLEESGKIIIVMTRWHSKDLAGRALEHYTNAGARIRHISYKAVQDDGSMLCPQILSLESYNRKIQAMGAAIASANYQQMPIDIQGALYSGFKTYDVIDPDQFQRVINYTDTADEGADYLCSISGGVIDGYVYITDVYYTDAPMEITEPELARRLDINNIRESIIESNNGGRGFARNIISKLKAIGNRRCNVTWFHQTKNKKTRILVNASSICEQIIMPEGWEKKWPQFHRGLMGYQRKGKNEHDDAPDALTGLYEFAINEVKGKKEVKVLKRSHFGI